MVRGVFHKCLLLIFLALEEIVADKGYHSNQDAGGPRRGGHLMDIR